MSRQLAGEAGLVGISVLNWNGWRDTVECLKSILQLDYMNYLTIIVENGSGDGSAERLKAWASESLGPEGIFAEYSREEALAGGKPATEGALDRATSPSRIVMIQSGENLGFAGGHNVAIHYALHRRAAADFVFLLNNDAFVRPGSLRELVAIAEKTEAGLVGTRPTAILREFFRPLLGSAGHCKEFEEGSAVCDTVGGEAMLASAAALRRIHESAGRYLDPDLFMYGEELDLGGALRQAGYQARLAQGVGVAHAGGGASGGRFNPLAYYYLNRNYIILAKRLLPVRLRGPFHVWNFAMSVLRIARNLLHWRVRSACAIAQGWLDGYRGMRGKWENHDRLAKIQS